MSQPQEKILEGLTALMERQGPFQDDFPGKPFVHSETEFGITMGPLNGSLYAMHHLIDSLNLSGYFDGERADRTDLETMMYEFGFGVTQIYDGVIAGRTEDGIILQIKTTRPVSETLKAISVGVDAAQAKLDRRQDEAQRYADNVRAEFSKESALPLFDEKTDTEFVKGYLKIKAASHFSSDPNAVVSEPKAAHGYSIDIFDEYGVTDTRPRFEITLSHTEEDYGLFHDFHNYQLGRVFTCPLAVFASQNQSTEDGLIELEVKGNPSRLVRDIVQNDTVLASVVAEEMGVTIPEV